MSYLWELRPYFRQVAGQLVLGSIAGIVMNTAVVLPAIFLGRAIDKALALERGEVGPGAVTWAALAFAGATVLTEGPRIVKRWWLMTANARIRANLRADALRGVLGWPLARLQATAIGEVMARIIGDVEILGVGVREFSIETWDTLLFSVSLIVALLYFDPGLTVLALLPVPLAMLLAHATGRWVGERTTRARQANADLTAALQEHLAGVRLLRLFGRASAAVGRVAGLSRRQADANLATARLRNGLQPAYTAIMTAGVILLVWRGGERVIAGAMTVGAFVAYLELYLRFVNRGFRVPQMLNSIQSGAAAYARIKPLLAAALSVSGEPPYASFLPGHVAGLRSVDGWKYGRLEVGDAPLTSTLPHLHASTPPPGPPAVSLDGVTFRYPGAPAPALRDVSLRIPAGALVAVTGAVGSGKSALARALLGLYPLEGGRVVLDGRTLEEIEPAERAALTGYLPQEGYLFSGSVRENVAMAGSMEVRKCGGEDAREQAFTSAHPNVRTSTLHTAVRLAALEEDLRAFPAGVDTEIGELGIRVSGGQRQRIALARALAACGSDAPRLLVLDDPFSAVDVETEAAIISGLRQAFGPAAPLERQATIVLCSHRLAAFPKADLVVVLEAGRIEEQGTHEALLRADGLYARIYRAQGRVGMGVRRSLVAQSLSLLSGDGERETRDPDTRDPGVGVRT